MAPPPGPRPLFIYIVHTDPSSQGTNCTLTPNTQKRRVEKRSEMGKRQQWNISTAYLNHVVAIYRSCAVFFFSLAILAHDYINYTRWQNTASQVVPANCQRDFSRAKQKNKTKHTDFSQPCLWVNNFIWPFFAFGLALFWWVWHLRNAVIQAERTSCHTRSPKEWINPL